MCQELLIFLSSPIFPHLLIFCISMDVAAYTLHSQLIELLILILILKPLFEFTADRYSFGSSRGDGVHKIPSGAS